MSATHDKSVAEEDLPAVDIQMAWEVMRRLVNVAFKKYDANGELYRPRFSIPYRHDDDDAILRRALEELSLLREVADAARAYINSEDQDRVEEFDALEAALEALPEVRR